MKSHKCGRPRIPRLSFEDVTFLKGRIIETYNTLAAFYQEVYGEISKPAYKTCHQPANVETVDRTFDDAFSQRRSLPKLYWKIFEDLMGFTENDLPSHKITNGVLENTIASNGVGSENKPGLPLVSGLGSSNSNSIDPQLIRIKQVANNLPRQDRQLIGREKEIEKLLRVLAISSRFWLMSITGVGGVGKTALALEVAYRCLRQTGLPDGLSPGELNFDAFVWTSAKQTEVNGNTVRRLLSVKPNLQTIVQKILKVVVPEKIAALPQEERQREMALEQMRLRRILLVVDNMETIEDEQVLGFLKDVPAPSKVIVTDRRAVFESYSLPLMELAFADAKKLIAEQCNSEWLRDRVDISEKGIDDLALRTGGIPLAIIWTLGNISATGADPSAVIRRLSTVGANPVLDFLFKESYHLISEGSKKLLAALALPGSAVRGEMLASWLDMGHDETVDGLDELKQFALINTHYSNTENHKNHGQCSTLLRAYRLLPLTREFVRNQGVQLDKVCREGIYEKLLSFVSEGERNVDWPSIEKIDLVEEYRDLLSWAVEDAYHNDRHELVVQLVRRLGYALGIRGYNDLRLRLAEMAIDSARRINNPQELGRALITNQAWVYFTWAEYEKCLMSLRAGEVAAQIAHDRMLQGVALRLTAQVAKEQKDLQKSEQLLAEALKVFQEIKDDYQLAITYGTWGSLKRDLADYKEAEKSMRAALELASKVENSEELQSIMCQKLTKLLIKQNRLSEAEEFNQKAEFILTKLRRQMGLAYCKQNKALIAEVRKDYKKALEYAMESATLFDRFRAKQEIEADLQRIQAKAQT